jgi:hypothetical protein
VLVSLLLAALVYRLCHFVRTAKYMKLLMSASGVAAADASGLYQDRNRCLAPPVPLALQLRFLDAEAEGEAEFPSGPWERGHP